MVAVRCCVMTSNSSLSIFLSCLSRGSFGERKRKRPKTLIRLWVKADSKHLVFGDERLPHPAGCLTSHWVFARVPGCAQGLTHSHETSAVEPVVVGDPKQTSTL